MRKTLRRGDLSAPVLAIIVTIGVIAAGLVIMAWFWWFAPTAGRTGALVISGTPVLFYNSKTYEANLTISVRNTGNAAVTITDVVILGVSGTIKEGSTTVVTPGGGAKLVVEFTNLPIGSRSSVDGVIVTDSGTYPFTAVVVNVSAS